MTVGGVPYLDNFSFAANTTYRCGGTARIAYFPENFSQAKAVYNHLLKSGIRYIILGNGSNVLAKDGCFDGAVICTSKLKGVFRKSIDRLFCMSGTTVSELLKYCKDNGFSGLEYLAGIPASCGGLTYMNGGAAGKYISENVASVKLYDGKTRNLNNKQCCFGHKYSIMRDINGLILGVELKIEPSDGEKVTENIKRYLNRRTKLPKGHSCGCVFKNVGEISAGAVIDRAGLKGMAIGSASVSCDHANFIISSGVRSADVYALIGEVKKLVKERTGIELEEEVIYIGDN